MFTTVKAGIIRKKFKGVLLIGLFDYWSFWIWANRHLVYRIYH